MAIERHDWRVVSREGGILLHRKLPGGTVFLVRNDDIGLELRRSSDGPSPAKSAQLSLRRQFSWDLQRPDDPDDSWHRIGVDDVIVEHETI